MTTAPPPPPAQWRLRVAHLARPLAWTYLLWFATFFLPIHPPVWAVALWVYGGFVALNVVELEVVRSAMRHLTGGVLCRWCAHEWPTNGAAQTERPIAARQLVLYHLLNLSPVAHQVFAVFGVGLMAVGSFGIWWLLTAGVGVNVVFAFVVGTSEARHRKLRPWCPLCRGRGGWDDVGGPIDTPDPVETATLRP